MCLINCTVKGKRNKERRGEGVVTGYLKSTETHAHALIHADLVIVRDLSDFKVTI